MADPQIAQRMDTLEDYMKELSYQALRTEREIYRLSEEMRQFKNEMRLFKDEMGQFKDEMSDFKDEMREFKDEMREFKDEMRGFKDEMLTFKQRSEEDRRAMNRKWGELANKMGTMVEDLVAPSLPRIARELFGCDQPELFTVRVQRRRGPAAMEVDALLACSDVVLLNETKSSLNNRDVDDILGKLDAFRACFPEYADRRCVMVLASLYVNPAVQAYVTRNRVLVMGMGEKAMQILNPEAA